MSDLDDIIAGNEPAQPEPVEQTPEAAPAGPEAPAEPVQEAPAEPEAKPEPMVPLAALMEVRDELKAFKRQAQQQQPQPEPQPIPDVLEDQAAFTGHLTDQVQQQMLNARLDMSEMMARDAHGDAVVDEALAAAQQAGIAGQFVQQKHAYDALVKWHSSQKVAAEIGNDPAAYKARLEAEIRQKIEAEQAAKQAAEIAASAPASLANVNGGGGTSAPQWAGPTSLASLIGE